MGSSYIDKFGYRRQRANPISRTGVFPYTGEQIDQPKRDPRTGEVIINPLTGEPEMVFGLEPKKLYPVLRGPEELFNPDAINSFNGLPIRVGHLMLGDKKGDKNLKSVDEEPADGCIYNVRPSMDEPGYLIAEFCIYTDKMKQILKDGKVKELSLGYTCVYEPEQGEFNGVPYMFKQTNLRGNHLALVKHGRCGSSVCVCDEAVVTFDSLPEGITLMENTKKDEKALDKAKKLADAIKGGDNQLAQDCLDFAEFPPEMRKAAFEYIKGKKGKEEKVEKEEVEVEDKATKVAKDGELPPTPPPPAEEKKEPAESPAPEASAVAAPAPEPTGAPPPADVPSPKDGEVPAGDKKDKTEKTCKDADAVCKDCGKPVADCKCGAVPAKDCGDKAAKDDAQGVTTPSIPTPVAAIQAEEVKVEKKDDEKEPKVDAKGEEVIVSDKAAKKENPEEKKNECPGCPKGDPAPKGKPEDKEEVIVKEVKVVEKPAKDSEPKTPAACPCEEKKDEKKDEKKEEPKVAKIAQDQYVAFATEYANAQALAAKLRPYIKEAFDSALMREVDVARFAAKHIPTLAFVADEANDEVVLAAVRGHAAAVAMDSAPVEQQVFEDVVKPAEAVAQDEAVKPSVAYAKDLSAYLMKN